MKIVTWNCNGAFRKKFEQCTAFDADLYIIQECENPAESANSEYKEWASNYLWTGDSKHKGIGVFAKKDIDLVHLNWTNIFNGHQVKYFLPCLINQQFNLLAVWNHYNNSPTFGYIGQLWKYLQLNKHHLQNSLIIGDFNSNSIWDKWDRWWNHSDVVSKLSNLGIISLYHSFFKEAQGLESVPTFYMNRRTNKSYHIDYAFGSEIFSQTLTKVKIGETGKWLNLSDHLPICFEFDYEKLSGTAGEYL